MGGRHAGQSGHNFELEIKASQKQSFLESMGELWKSLENTV